MVADSVTLNLEEQPLRICSMDSGFLPHPVLACADQFQDRSGLGGTSGSIDN